MSMFVYKGERGVKNALNSVYMVCTQSQSFKKYQENVWIKLLLAYKYRKLFNRSASQIEAGLCSMNAIFRHDQILQTV